MNSPQGINRIIVVVLDGLRADAVPLYRLHNLRSLAGRGSRTFAARTVDPSITTAAMTSLFSGVAPRIHGIESDGFRIPRSGLTLLPPLLADHGIPVHAFMATVPRPYRGLAARIASHIRVDVDFTGTTAAEIGRAAAAAYTTLRRGLVVIHWPDADRAGHAEGWTSAAYASAVRRLDDALGALVIATGACDDPGTVLIACADHGGGGANPKDHNSRHPLDVTIPIVLAGGQIAAGELAPCASLLDIPATIAWAFGLPQPASYSGRPLIEAFVAAPNATLAGTAA